MLNSEIEIGPVYHRLPRRIPAHALMGFMALLLSALQRELFAAVNLPASTPTHVQTSNHAVSALAL